MIDGQIEELFQTLLQWAVQNDGAVKQKVFEAESQVGELELIDILTARIGYPVAALIAENNRRWEERLRKAGITLPD